MRNLLSHAAFGCTTALVAASVTYVMLAGWPDPMSLLQAHAQAQPSATTGVRQIELFTTTMSDVMARVVSIRRTEREPGNGSAPHRHPGSHTFGYVLEGWYEV
ncbi:MAG: hypothetical protein ACXWIP_02505 [Burkholderiales bacterium]